MVGWFQNLPRASWRLDPTISSWDKEADVPGKILATNDNNASALATKSGDLIKLPARPHTRRIFTAIFYFIYISCVKHLFSSSTYLSLKPLRAPQWYAMATKRKREAVKPPTKEEWDNRKDLLGELYFELCLPKLMEKMETDYNFIAS